MHGYMRRLEAMERRLEAMARCSHYIFGVRIADEKNQVDRVEPPEEWCVECRAPRTVVITEVRWDPDFRI